MKVYFPWFRTRINPFHLALTFLRERQKIGSMKIHFRFYADEQQLHLSMKPEVMKQLVKLQDIKSQMTSNFLLFLNLDKTEVIFNFSRIN